VALFGGKQCRFSQGVVYTITQFGNQNMWGSHEGAKAIIVSTLKSLAEEVELPLCNVQLALSCQSRRTLARNKKRLTAGVLVSVGQDMLHKNVQCLSLMGGHFK
jgi:hypothetical protein